MQTIKKHNELEYLEVSNTLSSIKLTLQGAHIFDFRVKGKKPLLFLSETAKFEKGFPIRGGVPICWPWFGTHPTNPSLPSHGFARTSIWKHEKTENISKEKTKIIMSLKSSKESLALWPFEFELSLEIIISDILELALVSKNTGIKSFPLTQALHTYLQVEDVYKVQIRGLGNTHFFNKLDNSFDNIHEGILAFKGEVDRVYQDVSTPLLIKDRYQNIEVQTIGSNTVVVWNPGPEFKKSFSDLHDYKTMLCVESANALKDEIVLEPSHTYTLKSILSQKES